MYALKMEIQKDNEKRKYVNADFVIRALDDLGLTEYKEYVVKQVKAVILPEESDFRLKKILDLPW